MLKIALFDAPHIDKLESHEGPDWEESYYTIIHCDPCSNIEWLFTCDHCDLFITFGNWRKYSQKLAPVKERWFHFDDSSDLKHIGRKIKDYYFSLAFLPRKQPLVSVITPSYNIGKGINRAYESLKAQTYKNWEWVVLDDSDGEDDNWTYHHLLDLQREDHRIRVFKNSLSGGNIGAIKRSAFGLGRGEHLVELDHDDELTDHCLEWIVKTFQRYPEAGMCYTDCCEYDAKKDICLTYGDSYAFGYGSYRSENYNGKNFLVQNYPKINPKTVRHIVGVPNHVRAWRASTYQSIGGHNEYLHIADDYELIIRTFLNSRIAYIPKFGYIQHAHEENTTDKRRKRIQTYVRFIAEYYDKMIHERILKLDGDDFVWDSERGCSDMSRESNSLEHYCVLSNF